MRPGDRLRRAGVVLGPGLEADVGERSAVGDDHREHVAEHGRVGPPVPRLDHVRGQRGVEDVGDVGERRQGLRDGGGVGEVRDGRGLVGGGGPGRESAYTFHGPPGVSGSGRMPTRELPTMPVAPTTSATLRKCPSGAVAACSSCGCVWAAAPIARLHHQVIVLVRTYVAAGLEIEQIRTNLIHTLRSSVADAG
jgi:hypothetical protein